MGLQSHDVRTIPKDLNFWTNGFEGAAVVQSSAIGVVPNGPPLASANANSG
jgi:hypothetical protein